MRHTIISLTTLLLFSHTICANDSLRYELREVISKHQAKVGVAVMHVEHNDTLTINGQSHFPMQSVYKFHQALLVLRQVDEGKLKMDQPIKIAKHEYFNTWSRIMRKYPEGTTLPLEEVLRYTVSESDNVGCDVLFRLVGGTRSVHEHIRSLGISHISISHTEKEMHDDPEAQFNNWTTPIAMMDLLKLLYQDNILSDKSREFLWRTMVDSPVGGKRLKGNLPSGTIVAHKTGTGGKTESGVITAVNDVGIIQTSGGEHIIIVVFITEGKEDYLSLEALVAVIADTVFRHYSN